MIEMNLALMLVAMTPVDAPGVNVKILMPLAKTSGRWSRRVEALGLIGVLSRAEIPNLRRVKDQDFLFRAGIDVTDVRQVKGLEWDYVVLLDVNASSYGIDDESRHLLHIAATRAAHQLWLVASAEPSPLVSNWE